MDSLRHTRIQATDMKRRYQLFLSLFLLVIFSLPYTAFAAFPTTGLISYWKMDDNSVDAHTGGNNGTDTSITYSAGNGKINNGAGFDGTNSKIAIADNSNLNVGTGSFSISAWVKKASAAGAFGIASSRNAGDGWNMLVNVNKLYADGFGTAGLSGAGATVDNDAWHHLVVVYDRANLVLQSYVDGATDRSTALDTTTSGSEAITKYIGANGAGNQKMNGAIDEVGMWNVALTATQVSDLYNAGAGLAYPSAAAVVKVPDIIFFD